MTQETAMIVSAFIGGGFTVVGIAAGFGGQWLMAHLNHKQEQRKMTFNSRCEIYNKLLSVIKEASELIVWAYHPDTEERARYEGKLTPLDMIEFEPYESYEHYASTIITEYINTNAIWFENTTIKTVAVKIADKMKNEQDYQNEMLELIKEIQINLKIK